MSSKTATTIGFERRFNAALQAQGVEDFVRRLMSGLPPKPPNFDRIIARNRAQALPPAGPPRPLSAAQTREAMDKGAYVLDVRSPEEYGEAHVPGAIHVWIESPQFANRVGLFVPAEVPVVLVVSSPTDTERTVHGLGRIGLDSVVGHLQWGMTEWKSQGLPVARLPQISVHDLATMKDERSDLLIIDVREPFEWDEGHIDGALHLPMSEALARTDLVPADRPKAVLCAGGLRSSTVISALSRAGLTGFHNVIGGMTAWQKGGYSTVKR